MLDKRNFEGKDIFENVFGMMLTISDGYFFSEDLLEWFPDTGLIHFPHFYSTYTNIMLALSNGDIARADSYAKNLYRYYGGLEDAIDPWLLSRVTGYDDFCHKLASKQLSDSELQDFCRNTALISSLPYLEKILWSTIDRKTRSLAFIAIQCVIRT